MALSRGFSNLAPQLFAGDKPQLIPSRPPRRYLLRLRPFKAQGWTRFKPSSTSCSRRRQRRLLRHCPWRGDADGGAGRVDAADGHGRAQGDRGAERARVAPVPDVRVRCAHRRRERQGGKAWSNDRVHVSFNQISVGGDATRYSAILLLQADDLGT